MRAYDFAGSAAVGQSHAFAAKGQRDLETITGEIGDLRRILARLRGRAPQSIYSVIFSV